MIEEIMQKPLSILAVLALGLLSCKRGTASGGTSSEAAGAAVGMTESYVAKNGLITAHYPASFAASTVGTSSIVLARNLPGNLDEALSFVPIEKPISNDLNEFARVVNSAEVKELHSYVETSSGPASCVGNLGIESVGTWQSAKGTTTYQRKACHFLKNGHGYSIAYSVPSTAAATDEPTLRAIREATTFNR